MSEEVLPEGWVEATLGDVCSAPQYGWTTKGVQAGAIRLLRTTDITKGPIQWDQVPYCDEPPPDLAKYQLAAGDIVITRAGSVGASARIRSAPPAVFASYLIRFRPAEELDVRYVAHFLTSPAYWGFVNESSVGIAQPNINASKLRMLPVPLPPAAEQRRIADELERRLSHLDQAVSCLESAQRSIRRAKAAILQELVNHPSLGHPVVEAQTELLTQLSAETGRDVVPIGSVEGGAGASPILKLGDLLLRIEAGKSFACEGRPARADEWGVLKVSAMSWGRFQEGENKAIPATVTPDAHLEVRPGDLLISRANTQALVGASVLVGQCRPRLVLSDKSLRLVPASCVSSKWLQAVLSSPHLRRQLSDRSTGTKESMRNVTQENIRAVTLPVPPRYIQDAVVAETDRRISLIDAAERAVEVNLLKATQLRRSLLHSAFAGQLVPQDPSDEPASELLTRIKSQRAAAEAAKKKAPRPRRKKEQSG